MVQPEEAEPIAQRLIEVVTDRAIEIEAHQCEVGVSIGISLYPDHGDDGDELLKHSDAAMYAAKTAGKGRFAFFSEWTVCLPEGMMRGKSNDLLHPDAALETTRPLCNVPTNTGL